MAAAAMSSRRRESWYPLSADTTSPAPLTRVGQRDRVHAGTATLAMPSPPIQLRNRLRGTEFDIRYLATSMTVTTSNTTTNDAAVRQRSSRTAADHWNGTFNMPSTSPQHERTNTLEGMTGDVDGVDNQRFRPSRQPELTRFSVTTVANPTENHPRSYCSTAVHAPAPVTDFGNAFPWADNHSRTPDNNILRHRSQHS